MTLIQTSAPPSAPPLRIGETVWRDTLGAVLRLSGPIMLASLAIAILNLGQIRLLGQSADTGPLLLMSLMQPAFLLLFAILEAVSITAQVFSARSVNTWPRRAVLPVSLLLAAVGAVAVVLLVLALGWAGPFLPADMPILAPDVVAVLPAFLLSLVPLLVFEVINGALRGQGRTMVGFAILSLSVAVNLALLHQMFLVEGLGLMSVFMANAASGVLAVCLALPLLWLTVRGAPRAPLLPALIRMTTLLGVVGVPVLLSLLVAMVSSGILFNKLAGFEPAFAAGFLIVLRTRFFFLIPAVAMATAVALLVNQIDPATGRARRRATLMQGLAIVAVAYAGLTLALFAGTGGLTAAMAGDAAVRDATLSIFVMLVPSFFLVALVVAFQVLLENLDRGIRVAFWTLVLEGATCAALLWWAEDLAMALGVMVAAAVVYAAIFGAEFMALLRREARTGDADRRMPVADLRDAA